MVLSGELFELFDKWFIRRFPQEQPGGGYYAEWEFRFSKGVHIAMRQMDHSSMALWVEVVKQG